MFVLGFSYFLAHLFRFLFARFKIPDVLLFMLIGLVLGPLTNFVDIESFGRTGEALSTLTLVLILFDSGVNLDIKAFKSSWLQILLISILTAFITGAVFYLMGLALGLNNIAALILGAILCGTSSSVVIPMAQALKLSPSASTIAILESALTDVLCIILTTSFVGVYATGSFSLGDIGASVGISMLGAILYGLILGIGWIYLSKKFESLPNTAFATLAFGLLVYGSAEALGISGGITIMAYGFTLANGQLFIKKTSGLTQLESAVYSEMIFILKTFFFIYLGIALVFKEVSVASLALVATLIVFALRLPVVRFLASRDIPIKDRSYLSLLVPKGLAAAVLASLPVQMNIPGGETIQSVVYSVVFFSILICALITPFAEGETVQSLFKRVLGDSSTQTTNTSETKV